MKPEQGLAERIRRLLEDCERIKLGSEIDRPTRFNAAGERHARSIAAADLGKNGQRSATPDPQSVVGGPEMG